MCWQMLNQVLFLFFNFTMDIFFFQFYNSPGRFKMWTNLFLYVINIRATNVTPAHIWCNQACISKYSIFDIWSKYHKWISLLCNLTQTKNSYQDHARREPPKVKLQMISKLMKTTNKRCLHWTNFLCVFL